MKKTNYSHEYKTSNTWQEFPILNGLVVVLYISAAIAVLSGIISGGVLSERAWGDAKFAAFMGPFIIGLASAIGSIVSAELIKLFLHIQRNTYDTALYTYVIGMALQDIEHQNSVTENEQKSKTAKQLLQNPTIT